MLKWWRNVRLTYRLLPIFAAIGFVIYGHGLNNKFLYDDEEQIVGNTAVHSLENIPSFFVGSTMSAHGAAKMSGIYYRPVLMTSYALLWSIDPPIFSSDLPNAFYFHLFQLILYIANAWLFWLLCLKFFRVDISTVLAVLFLIHPINSEIAVYAANLQETLFVFFGLCCLVYLLYQRENANRFKTTAITGLLLSLSLLSKETGILFMPVIFLTVLWMNRKLLAATCIASVLTLGVYAILRLYVAELSSLEHGISQISRASWDERLLSFPKILAHYIGVFFWPGRLTVTQDWLVEEFSLIDFWLPFVVCVGFCWLLFSFLRKNSREISVRLFALLLVIGILLHAQFVPLAGTVSDRWMYVSVMGALGLIGVALSKIQFNWNKLTYSAAGFAFCIFSLRSAARTENWRDGRTLYEHDLALLPNQYDLHNNFGVELFRGGETVKAKYHFERSTEIAPHWDINWSNLGVAHEVQGDLEKAEQCFLRAVSQGAYYRAYENYGKILIKREKFDEARKFLEELALKRFPQNETLLAIQEFLKNKTSTAH